MLLSTDEDEDEDEDGDEDGDDDTGSSIDDDGDSNGEDIAKEILAEDIYLEEDGLYEADATINVIKDIVRNLAQVEDL